MPEKTSNSLKKVPHDASTDGEKKNRKSESTANEPVRRHGRECIYFESDGLIRQINVYKPGE